MSHVCKFRTGVLVLLISLANFSGAHAEDRRLRGEPLRDSSPPFSKLWDRLLGWLLPSEALAAEPPASGEPDDGGEGEAGDPGNPGGLGPEMDPNGKDPGAQP